MAMVRCPECKQAASDRAATCPHCGAPLAKNHTKTSTWIIGAAVGIPFLAVMMMNGLQERIPAYTPAPAASSPKPTPKVDAMATRAADGAKRLKKAMRNPESFRLESAVIVDGDSAICYEYRAENGFGGKTVGQAAIDTKTGDLRHSDMRDFNAFWDRTCGGKSGRDVANAVRMFAL